MSVQGREQGFGLAVQEPWIQHATVQDNILFGRDFDSMFYQAVIEACALADDLNVGVYLANIILHAVFPMNCLIEIYGKL